jgi:hypothetical protein
MELLEGQTLNPIPERPDSLWRDYWRVERNKFKVSYLRRLHELQPFRC